MEDLLADLNAEQRAAVEHDQGPALVIAGAGTGKTRVITTRIAHLIATERAKPAEILALTFTDKAAREMEERVDLLVPLGLVDTRITTFHAFGDHLIREYALDLGVRGDAPVMSRAEQLVFLREHLFRLPLKHYRPLGSPTKHLDAILSWISRCKDEAISPKDYLALAEKQVKLPQLSAEEQLHWQKQLELAKCWEVYEELKAHAGLLDFGDQVMLALRLLQTQPDVLAEVQRQYKYILVDEFQDTNYGQFELLKLLAGGVPIRSRVPSATPRSRDDKGGASMMVVGDDDQSIYKFRGAAISNILQFEAQYPRAQKIVLTQNYRSGQQLLDAAYRLIKHNDPDRLEVKSKIDKRLIGLEPGKALEVHGFTALPREADWVVGEIVREHEAGRPWSELAVLVRTHTAAQSFLNTLNEKGIPFLFSGGEGLYDRIEVRVLLDFVRSIVDPGDNESLFRLLVSEVFSVPLGELTKLLAVSRKQHTSLRDLIADSAYTAELPSEARRPLALATEKLVELSQSLNALTAGQLLFRLIDETGYLKRLVTAQDVRAEIAIANIRKFFDRVQQFQEVSNDPTVIGFCAHIDDLIEAGDEPQTAEADLDLDAVRVMTIHAAKGLEFEVVFCAHLLERHFPSDNRRDPLPVATALIHEEGLVDDEKLAHIQEERRLFYVAMTRTKERLVLSFSEQIGGKSIRKPSRFIAETTGEAPAVEKRDGSSDAELIGMHAVQEQLPLERSPEKRPLVLSYGHIDDYLSCPRKYWLMHVLRVPQKQEHQLVYGSAIHQAISEFYIAKRRGKAFGETELLATFDGAWSSEGFHSAEHERERKQQGHATLRKFLADHQKDPKPLEVESEFKFAVGETTVIGRLDLVMPMDQGAEIIDFKTSDITVQKDADKKAKDSPQLSIYALAYQNRYGKLPERLSLSYVESGLVGSVVRTEADIAKIQQTITEVAEAISEGKFEPSPSHPANCICRQYEGLI